MEDSTGDSTHAQSAAAQPSGEQPWSDRARKAETELRRRATGRRRQLSRFNEALADHVVREIEEEHQVAHVLTLAVRMLWPSFILAGGMLVGKLTGQSGWSIRELSLGFALSIIVGLLAARLSRRWRGESPQDVATDVNHPDQPSFVSIRRKRTRAPDE